MTYLIHRSTDQSSHSASWIAFLTSRVLLSLPEGTAESRHGSLRDRCFWPGDFSCWNTQEPGFSGPRYPVSLLSLPASREPCVFVLPGCSEAGPTGSGRWARDVRAGFPAGGHDLPSERRSNLSIPMRTGRTMVWCSGYSESL